MEREDLKQTDVAEDLDDIGTLINLLEVRSRLRNETTHFDRELE
jgi:hypothetical protein